MTRYTLLFVFVVSFLVGGFSQKYPCEVSLSKKAEKLYKSARDAQNKGKNDLATTLFKQCVEEQDDWAVPYLALARQAIRRIERSEDKSNNLINTAIEYFEKVVELCPQYHHESYLHLGKLYYSIGNYTKAIKNLEYFLDNSDLIKQEEQTNEAMWYLDYCKVYDVLYNSPVPFTPTPVKGISTDKDEYLGKISPDEDYFFFTRKSFESNTIAGVKRTEQVETFTLSTKQANGEFSVGQALPEPFNRTKNEGGPTITLDNNYLVFTRCENVFLDGSAAAYYNCDLYYAEKVDGQWSEIKNMGNAINRSDTWEAQASISADGKTLFYATNRESQDATTTDIFYSIRDANGNWQKAKNIGTVINTPKSEKTPFIHPDGKTLYFSSNGYTGIGGYDIYFSRKKENGTWGKPQNIGYPINSESDDVGLFVNTMGNKAYFSTNRLSGNMDICEFELYADARPNKVILIKGQVENLDVNPDGEFNTKIELQNVSNKQITSLKVDVNTGKYAAIIDDVSNDYLLTVKQSGYAYEAKYIASKAIATATSSVVENANFELQPIEIGKSYKINDIYFATNSFDLTEESKLVLNTLLDFLVDNPRVKIEIQGHTDNIGNRKDNLILSNNRAMEVYNYLINNHINKDRLSYKGYADTKPIADNTSESGRAKNRRTVFLILNN